MLERGRQGGGERILEKVFGEKAVESFEEQLERNHYRKGLKGLLKAAALQGAAASVAVAALAFYLGWNELLAAAAVAFALALPLLLHYFVQLYRGEQRKRAMEKVVPDLLLQASAFPAGTSMHKIIAYLAQAGYGDLSKEFARAAREIDCGASVEAALANIKRRTHSAAIGRAVNLLVQGYQSGADLSRIFRETAEDLLETNAIIRERASSLVVQKYTLLLAGGLIVPLVLGGIARLVTGLEFGSLEALELGLPAAERAALLKAALLGNDIYLAEYALLASLFVAQQEGHWKKAIVYASVLLPVGLAVYHLAG